MQVPTEFSLSLNLSLSLTAPSGPEPFCSTTRITCSHRQNALLISSLQIPFTLILNSPSVPSEDPCLPVAPWRGGFLCLLTPQQAPSPVSAQVQLVFPAPLRNSQSTASLSSLKLLRSFEANTLTHTLFLSFLSTFLPSRSLIEVVDWWLYRLPFAFIQKFIYLKLQPSNITQIWPFLSLPPLSKPPSPSSSWQTKPPSPQYLWIHPHPWAVHSIMEARTRLLKCAYVTSGFSSHVQWNRSFSVVCKSTFLLTSANSSATSHADLIPQTCPAHSVPESLHLLFSPSEHFSVAPPSCLFPLHSILFSNVTWSEAATDRAVYNDMPPSLLSLQDLES